MKMLCVDKQLLLCRNRSLAAELTKRGGATTSPQKTVSNGTSSEGEGRGQSTPSWLLTTSSEYEVM